MIDRLIKAAILLLPLVAIGALASSGRSECRDNWICVDEVRLGDRVELYARNLRDFPVTYTLAVDTDAFEIDGAATITRTLRPHSSEQAMRLTPVGRDANAAYSFSFDWTVGDRHVNHDDDHVYAFPYAHGTTHQVLQGYGARFSHRGAEEFALDFKMPEGTPVFAARGGIVARVEESHSRGCAEAGCSRWANYIVILHNDGTTGQYYHLQQNGAFVEVGDSVRRGQRIGLSGNTGHSASPHLHFAVYRASSWGDTQSIPVRFLSEDGIISRPRQGGRHQAVHL